MSPTKSLPLCLSALAAVGGLSEAAAQARIAPADPVQFERVALRQTVDSCAFDPETVRVLQQEGVLVVLQPPRQCFQPGPPQDVDIQLGAFPAGEYTLEIRHAAEQEPVERLRFTVSGLAQAAVVPAPPAPLADYGGIWWTPSESGWGLSLHQGRLHALFGALYVFDAAQAPRWYTLGSGQWTSSTTWRGQLFASEGPWWGAPGWDAARVQHTPAGTVEFDFTLRPEAPDTARMSYVIDGTQRSKTIARIRF